MGKQYTVRIGRCHRHFAPVGALTLRIPAQPSVVYASFHPSFQLTRPISIDRIVLAVVALPQHEQVSWRDSADVSVFRKQKNTASMAGAVARWRRNIVHSRLRIGLTERAMCIGGAGEDGYCPVQLQIESLSKVKCCLQTTAAHSASCPVLLRVSTHL